MLEFTICATLTILPDYLFRRYVQGKRWGHELTLFTIWTELRWGLTLCAILTLSLITMIFYHHPTTTRAVAVFRTVAILPESGGRVAEIGVVNEQQVKAGDMLGNVAPGDGRAATLHFEVRRGAFSEDPAKFF